MSVSLVLSTAPSEWKMDEVPDSPQKRLEQLANDTDRTPVDRHTTILALVQLAAPNDHLLLGQTSLDLAQAYLDNKTPEPAAAHAERAEALLLADAARLDSATLLPSAQLALATALSASAAALSTSRLPRPSHTATEQAELYKRAAEAYQRALISTHALHGKEHAACCPVLRGWAALAVRRDGDFRVARQLLQRELDVRLANAAVAVEVPPSDSQESTAISEVRRLLADYMLREAEQIDAKAAEGSAAAAASTTTTTGLRPQPNDKSTEAAAEAAAAGIRAAALRREAANLLASEAEKMAEAARPETTAVQLRLADAYAALEEWADAEAALIAAVPAVEEEHGCCSRGAVAIWAQLGSHRLQKRDFAAAAADFAHVLTMLAVVAGPESDELIRPAEQLCHARVMLGQWAGARDALSRARQLCALRYGADHPDTRRLDHVIRGIREQMSANDAETAKAAAQVEGLAS